VEEADPLTFRNRYTQNYGPLRNNWFYSSSHVYQLYRFKFKHIEKYKFTGRSENIHVDVTMLQEFTNSTRNWNKHVLY
jgi:hypothetical protein